MLKKNWFNFFIKKWQKYSWPSTLSMPCFYCNADSDELKYFLIIFIGGMSIGAVLIALGLMFKGKFQHAETLGKLPFEIEKADSQIKKDNP